MNKASDAVLLSRLPHGARIAIIRLRSLGDCVLTTPAISLLKAYRQDLRIDVIVEPRFAQVFEDNPDIDRILPEMTRDPAPPDLVLNLHGGTRSMWMTVASGAKYRLGFGHYRYSLVYTHHIPRAQEILGEERPVHTAEHVASAMFWLGVPRTEIPRAKLFVPARNVTNPHVMIHAFGSAPEKIWPMDRFVALARHLRDVCYLEPIFVAGPEDDTSALAEFRVLKGEPLSEVKRWMSGAALFVGNDSGPAHIAAAFGVPVVVLFGSSNPVTWAPWKTSAQVLVSDGGIADIKLDEVIQTAQMIRTTGEKVKA
ncbi:MAG: glycosyltransferase family 9 protein [Bryobacteraceae bacterium]